VDVVVRQEDIHFVESAAAVPQVLDGRIVLRSFVGSRVQYVVEIQGMELIVETPTSGRHAGLEIGAPVRVAIDPGHVYVNAAKVSEAA